MSTEAYEQIFDEYVADGYMERLAPLSDGEIPRFRLTELGRQAAKGRDPGGPCDMLKSNPCLWKMYEGGSMTVVDYESEHLRLRRKRQRRDL